MKLSELIEKYGDVELKSYEVAPDVPNIQKKTRLIVYKTYEVISEILKKQVVFKISKKYDTVLVLDKRDGIHLFDDVNRLYETVKTKEALFLCVLYYATDSKWCFDGDDVVEFEEEVEYYYKEVGSCGIFDKVDEWLEGLDMNM